MQKIIKKKFESYLSEIKRGNNKYKSKEQRNAIYNISMLNKSRKSVNKFLMIILQ